MRDIILTLPEQLAVGAGLGAAQRVKKPYNRLIVCGMGGSALAGEVLSMLRDDVIVHWDYDLPVNLTKDDLVVCTSWSGQTEETISSYQKARELGLAVLVIAAGGQLVQLAQEHGSPLILLPHVNPVPRANAGYMLGALLAALGLESHLPANLDLAGTEQEAKELAARLGGRAVAIYSAYPWRKLTGFWKMAYSETAKRQVFVNWFPSGAHNEVVGWEGPYQDQLAILLLRDNHELPRYAQNFEALLAILKQKVYTVETVTLSGQNLIEKVLNSYLLALLTSYYVAQSLKIDPQATALLDEFKHLKATR